MAIEKVRSGEIISADLMNFILEKLDTLEDAINSIGEDDRIIIDEILPEDGVQVGGRITIKGNNFIDTNPKDNVVTINGKVVKEYDAPSSARVLTVFVPEDIDVVDENGEVFTVTVDNEKYESAEARYRIYPKSSDPVPVIDSISQADDVSNPTLITGDDALIKGSNFSEDPQLNILRIEWTDNAGLLVFYTNEDIADKNGDIMIRSGDASEILFEVPLIDKIPEDETQLTTVTVRVGNASVSVESVNVFRPLGV